MELARLDAEMAVGDRQWYNKVNPLFGNKLPQGNYNKEDIYIPATPESSCKEMVHMTMIAGKCVFI